MNFLTLLLAATAVMASPSQRRQETAVNLDTTDKLLFTTPLEEFMQKSEAKDPATLDWSNDGCTMSPDNPLGFPFEPACVRHDFGYRNFKAQERFTESNKKRIDENFRKDLMNQCQDVTLEGTCNALADTYYAAVRAFGRGDTIPGKRDDDLIKVYEEKLAIYEALLEEAQRGNGI